MSHIAGIIYPSAFQVTDLIGSIGLAFSTHPECQYFRYKNLELGAWNTSICANERKNIWAFLDGQIYNAPELREQLKKQGFKFTQEDDALLLVHAYDAWEEDFLSHLNGPFALAVFDEEKETLLIARDRLGQKPLYWTTQGEYWLFSTEIKGLLTSGIVPQTPSIDALASYLCFGFIPQDLAAIQDVNKILPGHYLKVDLSRQALIGQYWSLSQQYKAKTFLSPEGVYDQFGKTLQEAFKTSYRDEETVGSFLTGDLGASSLLCFLNHLISSESLHPYTAFFDNPHLLELEKSKEITHSLSLTLQSRQITANDIFRELPAIIWHLDEPIADPGILQTWYLGQLASKKSQTVYIASGWSELLAGDPRYFAPSEQARHLSPPLAYFIAKLPKALRDYLVLPLFNLLKPNYKYRILRNIDIDRQQMAYLAESALFDDKSRKKVSPLLYRAFDPEVFTQRFHRLTDLYGRINPSLYYDAKTQLPDSLLFQYERLLQPHSLKVVAPFLDHHLVEFLAKVPEEMKFEGGIPASLLKNLMKRLFHISPPYLEPQELLQNNWSNDVQFRKLFSELIRGRLVEEGLISSRWIRQQLKQSQWSPRVFRQLWAILVMEVWFLLYINHPIDISLSKCSIKELFHL